MHFFFKIPLGDPFVPAVLTCHYSQSHLVFVIIEPAWNFHAAAIRPRVALLNLPDGQGHITPSNITHQQVTLRRSAGH